MNKMKQILLIIFVCISFLGCWNDNTGSEMSTWNTNLLYFTESDSSFSRAIQLANTAIYMEDSAMKDSLFRKSLEASQQGIFNDSSYHMLYSNIASIYIYFGHSDSAVSSLLTGINNTQHPELYFLLGIIQETLGDTVNSNKNYQMSLALYDDLLKAKYYTTNDEINRELVYLFLFGKDKTLENLWEKKKIDNYYRFHYSMIKNSNREMIVERFYYKRP